MSLLQRAVFMAAKRAASDPHLQARARRLAEEELVPRVREAAQRAKPAIDEAGQRARQIAGDLRQAAREHPPADDPEAFMRAAGGTFRRKG